jgi:hypothetical protein
MKITKSQLHQLIREEYVRAILESKGYRASDRQVRQLTESLDEGIFSSLGKAFHSGKEAYKQARGEDQKAKNEEAETKTQLQLKDALAKVRMQAKDKLKSNGYKGDDGDLSELGVDLFNAAMKEIVEEHPEELRKTYHVKSKSREAGMGKSRAS